MTSEGQLVEQVGNPFRDREEPDLDTFIVDADHSCRQRKRLWQRISQVDVQDTGAADRRSQFSALERRAD
jgi:hypothetical protein